MATKNNYRAKKNYQIKSDQGYFWEGTHRPKKLENIFMSDTTYQIHFIEKLTHTLFFIEEIYLYDNFLVIWYNSLLTCSMIMHIYLGI